VSTALPEAIDTGYYIPDLRDIARRCSGFIAISPTINKSQLEGGTEFRIPKCLPAPHEETIRGGKFNVEDRGRDRCVSFNRRDFQ